MSWQLTVNGHLADPDEEAAVLELCREFVAKLPRIEQSTTYAHFGGQYHTADLLADEGEPEA